MNLKEKIWFRGLIAALISGTATSIYQSFVTMAITPDAYNMKAGLKNLLMLLFMSGVGGAITGVAGYFKQSPLPPPDEPEAATEPEVT